MRYARTRRRCLTATVLLLSMAMVGEAAGQWEGMGPSASPFGAPAGRRPLTLENDGWTYRAPAPEVKTFKTHDVVTVVINELSVMTSEGEMDRKKKAHGELALPDWVLLRGLSLFPDPQSGGDPKVRGEVDNKMRSEADLELRDSLKTRISCLVVDIRDNGNMIIEGHDTVTINEEVWNISLTGMIRAQDVQPDNTVLSENIVYKRLVRHSSGHVRDGWDRGWLLKFLDRVQPF